MPIRASRWSAFQGQPATSAVTANGLGTLGGGVVVGEVVEHLLDAHGVLGRQRVLLEKPPDVGVARRVDVDRERREGFPGNLGEFVLDDLAVRLAIQFGMTWLPLSVDSRWSHRASRNKGRCRA